MQEDPSTLITPVSSGLHSEEVARRTFATVRKGLDPREVQDFLQRVSRELERQGERETELRRRLADAEYRAAHPKLDEEALTTALGEETARVLRSAFDAAREVRDKAEEGSARAMAEATERAGRVRQEAENEVAEKHRTADAEAGRVVEAARAEAGSIVEAARHQGRSMLEEAQQLRSRVLGDLARRRQRLEEHVERLRAGRESLLDAIREAVTSLERVEHGLRGAEEESRPAPEGPEAGPGSPSTPEERSGGGARPASSTEAPAPSPVEATARVATVEERPRVADTDPESAPVQTSPPEPGQTGAAPEGTVGQLFARIKAAQGETRVAERVTAPTGPNGQTTTAEEEPSRPSLPEVKGEAGAAGPPDQALFEQRDALIAPLALSLARRLKRALQDEQNALLDHLRRQARRGPVPYLPPEAEQRERFRRAAVDVLVEAERAGAQLSAGPTVLGTGTGESGAKEADALAEEVATALRHRLEERIGAQGGSDHSGAVEAVGATYREWRGTRIERAAMDHVVAAYSSGVVAATPKGTTLRWVSRDEDGECADCDDNALAGALPPGEAFPTGQIHPPAHSGCRCLLAPASN